MTRILLLLFFSSALTAQTAMLCPPAAAAGTDSCPVACILCDLNGYHGATVGYTASAEPNFCQTVENDQWLGFRAAADSIRLVITPSNCQQGKGLEAAIYTHCGGFPVVCAPGGDTTPLTLKMPTVKGQNYFLRVDGRAGDHCQFGIAVTPTDAARVGAPGPAAPVAGPAAVQVGSSNTYAIIAVPNATAYVWSATGPVLINGQPSPVTVPAATGTSVNVVLNGQNGTLCVAPVGFCGPGSPVCKELFVEEDPFVFTPPCTAGIAPGEDCEDACIICDFNGYTGTTDGWTTGGGPPGFCGIVDNDQWIGFIAGKTAGTITAIPANCSAGNGLQMALYPACDEPFLACNGGVAGMGNDPISLSVSGLVPGHNYYLRIDGYNGDVCDFTLQVSPPTTLQVLPIQPVGPLSGPAKVCPGATVTYSVDPVDYAGGYTWTVPPGALVNGQPGGGTFEGPGGHQVTVTFPESGGSGVVCVKVANSCFDGGMVCKNVQSQPIPPTTLPTVRLCYGDLYDFEGSQWVNSSGIYTAVYSSYQGCDSIVRQQVIFKPPIITQLPPKAVCEGSCVTVCGEDFCSSGQFEKVCSSAAGCDSTIFFSIFVLAPHAEILASTTLLTCTQSSITLHSAISPPGSIKVWKKADGNVLATNTNDVTVFQPGIIILTTTQTQGGVTCTKADTIEIVQNTALPTAAAAASDTLTCSQPTVQLLGDSDTPGALFAWSGPNGFVSADPSPTTNAAGVYTLTVTNPVSQCTATATVEVSNDGNLPAVTALGGTLTCDQDSVMLTVTTNAQMPAFAWSGPGGFVSNAAAPLITVPGMYTVVVTDGLNHCMGAASAEVWSQQAPPSLTALGDTITCSHPVGRVAAATSATNPVFNWSGPDGFSSSVADPIVSVAGAYLVTVTDAATGCTATAETVLGIQNTPPTIEAAGGTLSCNQPSITLMLNTSAADPVFAWSGPFGFSSNVANPGVSEPGIYKVTVTDGTTGCTATATAVVLIQVLPPLVAMANGTITCCQPSVTLMTTGGGINLAFLWSGPNGFTDTLASPSVSAGGAYTVVVTDGDTGCTSVSTIIVGVDTVPPQVVATGGTLGCDGAPVILSGSSSSAAVSFTWTGPGIPEPTPTPVVSQPGIYTLLVTALNGCTGTATAEVVAPQIPEVINVQVEPDQNGAGVGSITLEVTGSADYSVDWSLNGQPFAQTQNLTGLMAGIYTAVVTSVDGCTATVSATVDNLVGTTEPGAELLWEIKPNPANDFLDVHFRGDGPAESHLVLFDLLGQKMLSEKMTGQTTRLRVENLPEGQYQLSIRTGRQMVLRPVIIQR